MAGVESMVMERWTRARGTSFGRWLFSRAVGRFAPYTGTIGARIEELEPGQPGQASDLVLLDAPLAHSGGVPRSLFGRAPMSRAAGSAPRRHSARPCWSGTA